MCYIEQAYPKSQIKAALNHPNPASWAHYNFELAQHFVYSTPKNKIPSTEYTEKAQKVIEKQTAIAGYRLAVMLNQLFN